MKRTYIGIAAFSLAAFMTGCQPSEPASNNEVNRLQEDAATEYEEARDATQEAARAANDYADAQKTAFVAEMEQRLAALRKDVDELRVGVADSSEQVKAEAQEKFDNLSRQADKLDEQLKEIRSASDSNWEALKDGFETAYNQTKQAFNDARQWMSEKLAPSQS
jgi:hypothetical protein